MKLKRLEIIGFKTFRDKVVLDFSEGITGVVGPNGCGKSNIVDAIRWAMGEQRVKSLRGKKMDDVVFHGAEDAAPVGMAEVSIILEQYGQTFPGAYAECSEVMISRRLFRDGDSEYAINKVPCRLLDVREFFMGTGVGTKAYSIVEQNSVSSLVEAKPEERRQFLEDAAGISKYKSRKESATRKMEATQQNILRLNDIIKEVKTQLNAVSRQAKRAEQYRALKTQIREAEIALALQGHTDLSAKRALREERRAVVHNRDTEIRTNLSRLESTFESIKVEILNHEEQSSRCQETLYDIRNTINIKEQKIEYTKNKIKDISARKQKNVSEIETLRKKQATIDQEIDALRIVTEEASDKIRDAQALVLKDQAQAEEIKKAAESLRRDLEERKIKYIDIATEKAKTSNMISSLGKGIEDVERRAERDNREIDEQKKRLALVHQDLDRLRAVLKSDEECLQELKERKRVASSACEESKRELEETDEAISEKKEDIGRKSSRLNSLKELHESYAGCHTGIKSIMTADGTGDLDAETRNAFVGLVADHIDVPREYETAVEAVLGDRLQYIVVKRQEDGAKAIDYLKSYSLGRGSFVPLEVRNDKIDPNLADHLQETTRLVDMVKVRQDFRKIADYLLGDVLLIPNLNRGISLWAMNGFRGTMVTPEGDIISPHGVLTGGSKSNGERSLLRDKREIAELEEDVNRLAAQLEADKENRKRSVALLAQWEEEITQSGAELHRLELQINGAKKDTERLEDEIQRTEQRIHVLEFSYNNLQSEGNETRKRIDTLRQAMTSIENQETSEKEKIASLQEAWQARNVLWERQGKNLTDQKILLNSLEEKREANLKTLSRLKEDVSSTAAEVDMRIKDIETCADQVENMTTEIATEQNLLQDLYRDYESAEKDLAQKKGLQQEMESLLKNREMEIREVKKDLDQLLADANELEMEYREISFQMDTLKKGVEEKYNVPFDALIPDFRRLEESDIGPLSERLIDNRRTIENFGEVNLLALSEHDQIKERYDFLSAQVADLDASLNTLQMTITRINQISRKRFAETFEAVNRSFKEVFARIFPGGKGNLRLTDESDLLETGVDIDIVIPGKRSQSISLLSGGEKSLSAIALIFAILLYRPAPFLILDEVDAALDDANIALFNNLVRDTAAHSQIVVVTHNKQTMEVAQHLFGVTMQKQGISSIVSVALN